MKTETQDNFVISDLETLKLLSNPLRLQILERIELANQQGDLVTAKQLADWLDQSQTKMYYHIKLLEEHGLIEVAETELVSGIPEKRYRVMAKRISIAEDIFPQNISPQELSETVLSVANTVLEGTRSSFQALAQANIKDQFPEALKEPDVHISRELATLSVEQANEFHERLSALVAEYTQLEPSSPENYTFGLTTLFYPVLYD
ncbi:MAG: ArsR family transcriptional regulator [Chloroflexi bacterium]|nr:MAG: ArsR family transcriptional regulator [Chloroflexota bacterium]MBL1193279.1 ArsR family transcriptional regulator [Chloroflexota bacterium]NOH10571.1 helix-turn-helix transcriptional regulator [Chloroflexota bacterium]